MKRSWQAALGAALVLTVSAASAQQSKGVRIVVAFPAGGPIDIVARMLAPKLTEVTGQPVVVDNRAGANGIIGTDHVAKSAPDGQTMILASVSAVAISPAVYPKIRRASWVFRASKRPTGTASSSPRKRRARPSAGCTKAS